LLEAADGGSGSLALLYSSAVLISVELLLDNSTDTTPLAFVSLRWWNRSRRRP
jgi:hypothetical protein